jgi:flagellar hook-basal body complex protein FliE
MALEYVITDGVTTIKNSATSMREAVEIKNKLETSYNWVIKIKRKENE